MTVHVTQTLHTRYSGRYTQDLIEFLGKNTHYTRYTILKKN